MIINVIIEMPKGTSYKYEVDKDSGRLVLDRVLELQIPENYGFIPNTLSEDGDPLDVFVFSKEPIPPLTKVTGKVLGGYACLDSGVKDDKIFISVGDSFDWAANIFDYLSSYKRGFQVLNQLTIQEASDIVTQSMINYNRKITE